MGRLQDKVALITGAAGGIGRETCKRFIEEGAKIVALDINQAALDDALSYAGAGKSGMSVICDITDPAAVEAAMAKAVAHFGRLDVLCNNAGGSSSADGRVTEAPVEEFHRAIGLDLFGTFLCCKYGIPHLQKAGGGAIVNLSSMAALTSLPERDCYTAAKGGVTALTRTMAFEYAPDKIRVNAVAPGLVMTPRLERLLLERAELRHIIDNSLLGPCEPIDIANMIVYLACDESRRVTGQIMPVDSGVTIHYGVM